MAAASDPLAAAAVSALCWVPRGAAAERPRSYLLEAQDRHTLGAPWKQQLQKADSSFVGRANTGKKKKKGKERGKEKDGGKRRQGDASAAADHMQVDDDDRERKRHEEDDAADGGVAKEEETAKNSGVQSMDAEEEEEDDSAFLFGVVKEDGPATLNDPYLDLEEEDSEEEEANRVLPSDLLLVAANAEHDLSSLEVYVYDEDSSSFYVHHDILTGGYPLCLEWVSTCPSAATGEGDHSSSTASGDVSSLKKNIVASGSFDPDISLWDLDVLDCVDAICTLGGEPTLTAGQPAGQLSKNKKKKKQRGSASAAACASTAGQQGHEGPVMTLHKAPMKSHILASGSGDESVKLWDLSTAACVHTYNHHTNKVQTVRWHPAEEAALLTAAYDRRAAVLDVRSPHNIVYAPSLTADAECCVWDRHRPFTFWVSTEDGWAACYDVRRMSGKGHHSARVQQHLPAVASDALIWRIHAHKQAASSVTDSQIPGMMVTCGIDGNAKLWKVPHESSNSSAGSSSSSSGTGSGSNGGGAITEAVSQAEKQGEEGSCAPILINKRDLQAGPLYCCSSNEDVPQVLGFGGNCVVVWDITDTESVKKAFRL